MKLKINLFFLCVVDSHRKIYSVEGPMVNDEPWNEAVCKAQSSGEQCATAGVGRIEDWPNDHEKVETSNTRLI